MSYVQGTAVQLIADFADADTGVPFDPEEVVVTIRPPSGVTFTATLSGGEVVNDATRTGRFYYVLDTEPEFGNWQYQFEADGPIEQRVVQRKAITVTKRI